MQLPSQAHLDVVPDHIDPIPIPETKEKARSLRLMLDIDVRLAVPRESIQDSGDHDLHACTSSPGPFGS